MTLINKINLAKVPKQLVLITTILGLLVLFALLGSTPLLSLNEGRRALVIKEMFISGNWLLPTQNGALYLTKPPMFYWVSLCIAHVLGGVNEWALRLPSALAASITIAIVYRYTKQFFNPWAALFSAQLLIINAGFAMLARRAEIEMLLTLFCSGAMLAAIYYIKGAQKLFYIYLSYFLLALAVLTKGPVALLFVTLPLLLVAIFNKDARIKDQDSYVKAVLLNKTGWLIFALVASSWYVVVSLKLGWHIWGEIIQRDMVNKMQSEDAAKPLLSYIGWILVDSLMLLGLFLIKPKQFWYAHKHNLAFLIPVVLVVSAIVVFSAFNNKHAKYLLPIYPFIAILLAVQLTQLFQQSGSKIKSLILVLGLALPLVYAVFYIMVEPKYFNYRVATFVPFQQWTKQVNTDQFYILSNVDSRLIYYADKPIKQVTSEAFDSLLQTRKELVVLAENQEIAMLDSKHGCHLQTFEPYLKKHKKLVAFGFGAICPASSSEPKNE